MNTSKAIVLTVLLVFAAATNLFSQTHEDKKNGNQVTLISGRIIVEDKKPISGLKVGIQVSESTYIYTLTDDRGRYELKILSDSISRNYLLKCEIYPHGPVTKQFSLLENQLLKVVDLKLEKLVDEIYASDDIIEEGASHIETLDEIIVESYEIPLIEKDASSAAVTITREEVRSVGAIAETTKGKRKKRRKKSDRAADAPAPVMAAPAEAKPEEIFHIKDVSTIEPIIEDREISAGILTGSKLNDLREWDQWLTLMDSVPFAKWQQHWNLHLRTRITITTVNEEGEALPDATVKLLDELGNVIWVSRSDNSGIAELWMGVGGVDERPLQIQIELGAHTESFSIVNSEGNYIRTVQIDKQPKIHKNVDIAFVIDATGSMGDEMEYLKVELADVITRAKDSIAGLETRVGITMYRDKGEDYLTRIDPFQEDVVQSIQYLKKQMAFGGGDYEEAVEDGLDVAINDLDWSKEARARLLFLVLDAPPHHNDQINSRLQRIARNASRKGIKIIPVTASGLKENGEFLLRFMAMLTNGEYIYLTDDSGIGGSHHMPQTEPSDVMPLNDLIVEVILDYTRIP